MDKNEYRRRIEELAVIKDRKPAKSPSHNRLAKEVVIEIDEDTGEEYEVEREITENETLGFELVKIKDRTQACELGCGDIVTNQVVEKRYCSTPKSHWRTRCQNCDHYVSPDGVGFIKGGANVQHAYQRYFNQGSKKEQTTRKIETPDGITRITEFPGYTEFTTNNNIIRRYK